MAGLNLSYGLKETEKSYVQDTLDKEGVDSFFKKELSNLSTKIVRKFHNDNYVQFEQKKLYADKLSAMKTLIDGDADMKKKYEAAVAKNYPGFSDAIAVLQTIAIKCVETINQDQSVETKLTSRDDAGFKSQAIDGILGPNTFYVLASIAKESNIPFNGIVDDKLLDRMLFICGSTEELPVVPPKDETEKPADQETPESESLTKSIMIAGIDPDILDALDIDDATINGERLPKLKIQTIENLTSAINDIQDYLQKPDENDTTTYTLDDLGLDETSKATLQALLGKEVELNDDNITAFMQIVKGPDKKANLIKIKDALIPYLNLTIPPTSDENTNTETTGNDQSF